MKGWRFADGQVVDARSVMFFLNMYKADPTAYCGYNAGLRNSRPGEERGRSRQHGAHQLHDAGQSELGPRQLPLGDHADARSLGPHLGLAEFDLRDGAYGAASTDAACSAVHGLPHEEGRRDLDVHRGASGRAATTVRGDSRAFDAAGDATFEPNPKYQGPQKAQVRFVKEIAYTTLQGEESDLLNNNLSIGYIDPSVLTGAAPAPGKVGPNWVPLASHYSIVTGSPWSFNYAAFNFTSSDPERRGDRPALHPPGAAVRRRPTQSSSRTSTRATARRSTVPCPPTTPTTLGKPIANPYPFNFAAARTLLSAHGWTLVNNVQTCTDPGTGDRPVRGEHRPGLPTQLQRRVADRFDARWTRR